MEAAPRTIPPLRIAMLGDFDGPHTRAWVNGVAARGHEVHAVSFYAPRAPLPAATVHVLRPAGVAAPTGAPTSPGLSRLRAFLPPSLERLLQAKRYAAAGLKAAIEAIAPDVLHAHFVVEHGYYGASLGFHPYVVSGWGSDLFVAPRAPLGRRIARTALAAADLVTVNDAAMGRAAEALGVPRDRVAVVRLGVAADWLAGPLRSVNLGPASDSAPTILSNRALEPLYNIDVVVRAFARLREATPDARLWVMGEGSQRGALEALSRDLGLEEHVVFYGHMPAAAVRKALTEAHVYTSVPSSDSFARSTMEAMASGAFPIVSDLPSQEWIADGANGLRVPPGDVAALATAMASALSDTARRARAARANRARIEIEGSFERNMELMERYYYRLAGRPLAEDA